MTDFTYPVHVESNLLNVVQRTAWYLGYCPPARSNLKYSPGTKTIVHLPYVAASSYDAAVDQWAKAGRARHDSSPGVV